jgi:hypothetical protein
MANSIRLEPFVRPVQLAADVQRGHNAGQALDVAIASLAVLGSAVRRAAGSVRTAVAAWGAARQQREQDGRLWKLALSDARIMAELNRAMNAQRAE